MERDLLNLDPIKWKRFEYSNLQELCCFQPEENDVGIF
jgi:hypothetical protein